MIMSECKIAGEHFEIDSSAPGLYAFHNDKIKFAASAKDTLGEVQAKAREAIADYYEEIEL